jgi:hypothetical protein
MIFLLVDVEMDLCLRLYGIGSELPETGAGEVAGSVPVYPG